MSTYCKLGLKQQWWKCSVPSMVGRCTFKLARLCVRLSSGLEADYKCESETAGERRGHEFSLNTFQNNRADESAFSEV